MRWREGKRTAAERFWLRSAAAAESIGARYQLGLATVEIGRCFKRHRELEHAAVLFREAGAGPDLARVENLLSGRVSGSES